MKQFRVSYFQVLNTVRYLSFCGFSPGTLQGANITKPHTVPHGPQLCLEYVACSLSHDLLTFFQFFENVIFLKFLGVTC